MTHEFLLKQNQFSDKIKNIALKQMVCAVNKSCRNYGGNNVCAWRQFYWVNTRLLTTCHYPRVSFDDCNENDIADIKQLIDIQIKHMVQDSKEIKEASYTEVNTQKCGEVKTKFLNEIKLDIDVFKISGHVKKLNDLKNIQNCTILFQWGRRRIMVF